jgi:hypothetical protein
MRPLFIAAGDMNFGKRSTFQSDLHQYGAALEIDAPVTPTTRRTHIAVDAIY